MIASSSSSSRVNYAFCTQPGCAEVRVEPLAEGLCRGHALSRAVRALRVWGWVVRGVAFGGGVLLLLALELRAPAQVRLGLAVGCALVLAASLVPFFGSRAAVARLTARR